MKECFYHVDRTGGRWAFAMPETPIQLSILRSFMLAANKAGARESLRTDYYKDFDKNERFCVDLERKILSALAELYPVEDMEPQAPAVEAEAVPLSSLGIIEDRAEAEDPLEYWWESM